MIHIVSGYITIVPRYLNREGNFTVNSFPTWTPSQNLVAAAETVEGMADRLWRARSWAVIVPLVLLLVAGGTLYESFASHSVVGFVAAAIVAYFGLEEMARLHDDT